MGLAIRLGWRNLARNRWRTGLTLAAIAVAVALMVWTLAMYEGWLTQMIRGATAVEVAQVDVNTAGYVDSPRVYRAFAVDDALLGTVRGVPGVVGVSPRVKAAGLLGNEERSQVVRFIGVDPQWEETTTPVPEGIERGRWLGLRPPPYPAPREIVLGWGVARQLEAGIGDELVGFLEAADGSLGNELFVVVGVVRTGNTGIDRMAAYIHLETARFIAALDGQAHELAIATTDLMEARASADAIAAAIGVPVVSTDEASTLDPDRLVVRPWQEVMPGIDAMILLFRRSYWIMYLLVYLVAAVGILNTQRMGALERRREFGMFVAIGMRPRRLLGTLQVETLLLGASGALIGAALGGALAWYHARFGFDLGLLADAGTFTYMGVAFSDRLYFELAPFMFFQPVLVMFGVTLVSGIWPSWRAARVDPAPTIAGRA